MRDAGPERPGGGLVGVDDLHVGHVPRHVIVQQQAVATQRVTRVQADSARLQAAFYPQLPFSALSAPGERRLAVAGSGGTPLDVPIDMAACGASLLQVEPPAETTVKYTTVLLIRRAVHRSRKRA